MDALEDWFFWTWEFGNSATTSSAQAPLWSYVLARAGERLDTDGPATGAEQVGELECEAGVVRWNI